MPLLFRRTPNRLAAILQGALVPAMLAPARRGRDRPLIRRVTPTLPTEPLLTLLAAPVVRATPRDEEEYTTQLPQTFQRGLPPSNLEPATVSM